MIKALTRKVEQCTEELNSQALGNALFGIHCLHDSPELRGLLAVLASKVAPLSNQSGIYDPGGW